MPSILYVSFIQSMFILNIYYLVKDIIQDKMEGPIKIKGSKTEDGNYVWGGALTLAWKQLSQNQIKQQIKIQSKNKECISIVQNYNMSPFNKQMLSPQCYYVASGWGNKTINRINKQVSQKFANKTTPKIQQDIGQDEIISYAYLYKKLRFVEPFKNKQVKFGNTQVPGFQAKPKNKKYVIVHHYEDDDNFVVQLQTTVENDHLILIKSKKNLSPEEAVGIVDDLKGSEQHLKSNDVFQMPVIKLRHRRQIKELKGVALGNKKFEKYRFQQLLEIINLDIDETGATVQNEGVIRLMKCKKAKVEIRKFLLDRPFWIVMRQKQYHPYLVAFINKIDQKQPK